VEDLFDPELIEDFYHESSELVASCKGILDNFLVDEDSKHFEQFGLFIDRIMGAAYTLGLSSVGDLSKLGKELSYKASQVKSTDKLLSVHSLLAQLLKLIGSQLKSIRAMTPINQEETAELLKKLRSASQNLGNLRTSVKIEE
jgi:hypothetical protein